MVTNGSAQLAEGTRLRLRGPLIGSLILLLGVVGAAHAVGPNAEGIISACVNNATGAVRIVDARAQCKNNESPISWSQTGPTGPAGAMGPQGPAGPQGAAPSLVHVTLGGSGVGFVSSSPAGLECGGTCLASFADGTEVSLAATSASGSSFAGWSGACTGQAACIIMIGGIHSVRADFELVAQPTTAPTPTSSSTTTTPADLPTVSFWQPASYALEGTGFPRWFSANVDLSHAVEHVVKVSFVSTGGTATPTSDYASRYGVLTFEPGQTRLVLQYEVVADTTVESDETFHVYLSDPQGATLGASQHTFTILNDD